MACIEESSIADTEGASVESNVCRKYSHCERGLKLFGVRLMIRKSVSTGNLTGYGVSAPMRCASRENSGFPEGRLGLDPQGYVSEGLVQKCETVRERKKGVPWTEEEHRLFLVGLQKLGKGDWRGISRNFVPSRTPTQVASHAQKYFLRQSNVRKRRSSSLFDIISTNTMVSVVHPSRVSPPSMAIEQLSPLFTHPQPSSPCSETVGVSAELCLGRPSERADLQGQKCRLTLCELKQGTSSTRPQVGFPQSPAEVMEGIVATPTRGVWASTSRAFPLYKTDTAMEPSSSGIGLTFATPPLTLEQPLELSLKLEQPAVVPRHSAFHSSTMPVAMVPKNSSGCLNAIKVV